MQLEAFSATTTAQRRARRRLDEAENSRQGVASKIHPLLSRLLGPQGLMLFDENIGRLAENASRKTFYEEYHPYGTSAYRAFQSSEVSARRYRYTGKERDEETSLYYYGARYYAPWLGRWTAADPAGLVDGPGLYNYARGSPVTLHDPNGEQTLIDRRNEMTGEGYEAPAGQAAGFGRVAGRTVQSPAPTPAEKYEKLAAEYGTPATGVKVEETGAGGPAPKAPPSTGGGGGPGTPAGEGAGGAANVDPYAEAREAFRPETSEQLALDIIRSARVGIGALPWVLISPFIESWPPPTTISPEEEYPSGGSPGPTTLTPESVEAMTPAPRVSIPLKSRSGSHEAASQARRTQPHMKTPGEEAAEKAAAERAAAKPPPRPQTPRDIARQRGSELLKQYKHEGVGTGAGRSGGHGTPHKRAGAELIRQANKLPKNDPLREALKKEGERLIQRGKSISHR